MKLNNITCTNYSAGERFLAILSNTTEQAILNINAENLTVYSDDGTAVETYRGYGRLFSIKKYIKENTYEVEFCAVSDTEKDISTLKNLVNKSTDISVLTFVALAQNETLDPETIMEHSNLFVNWDENWTGKAGSIVRDGDFLYRSIHDVGKGQNTKPADTPSMWTIIGNPAEEFPEWSQPIGAHDAYGINDKVSHNEKHWQSIVENNIWEPGVYGWENTKEE